MGKYCAESLPRQETDTLNTFTLGADMTADVLFKFWLVGASVDVDLLVFCAGRSPVWDGGEIKSAT